MRVYLLIILLGLVVDNIEEAELVNTLGGGDDTEPVTELLLLEELLGTGRMLVFVQFLKVPALIAGSKLTDT